MLKGLSILAVTSVLAFSLSACGKSEEQKKQEAQEQAAKKFWEESKK